MTTNIERAAEEIRRVDGDHTMGAGALAEALNDAGLLARDLPAPDRDGRWWPKARQIGSVRRVGDHVVWEGFEGRRHSIPVEHVTEFGRMIQAAAQAEKENTNE